SEFSLYDLGQAVAHLGFQAAALGLAMRQFRAFDRDGLAAEFAVPPHWQVTTLAAIGRVPPGTAPDGTRDRRADVRWPPLSR
ncbi:MAG: nitroreductase family protein, partial [Jatrophihabitans sp.]